MKRLLSFLNLENWIGKSGKSKKIVLTDTSQRHRLIYHMQVAVGLRHGDKVKADIKHVQLMRYGTKLRIYFCNMYGVEVTKLLGYGDGMALPDNVKLKGLATDVVPETGIHYFNLKNVTLYSNGKVQVIADKDTVIEPCEQHPLTF